MRAQIVQAGLTAAVVAGLFAIAVPLPTTSAFAQKIKRPPARIQADDGRVSAQPTSLPGAADLKLSQAQSPLPQVMPGWYLRPTLLRIGGGGAEIKPDTKEILPVPAAKLIALIIKDGPDIDPEVNGNFFRLVDAGGSSANASVAWSENRLSLKLLQDRWRTPDRPRDWRAEFVADSTVYQVPYIAVCDGCDRREFLKLRLYLAQLSAASSPSTTPPPPAASSSRQLMVRIIGDDGKPVDRRWSISAFSSPCNQRRNGTPSQLIPDNGTTIDLPAPSASEIYCLAFSPSPGPSGTVEQKCLKLHAGFSYWTPYESIITQSSCPPSQSNVSVVFKVKNGVTAEERLDAAAFLSRVKPVTIRNKALINGVFTLDLADNARPWLPEDVKVPNDLYRVEEVKPDSESDPRQLTVTLSQQFVDLNSIKIAPQDSNGRLEQNCVLRLAVQQDTVVQSEAWSKILRNSAAADNGKIKINWEGDGYVLPKPVRDEPKLQIRWPQEPPGPSPITISVAPGANPAECNLNLQGEPKLDRKFFFGETFRPVVRQSKPGFEVIATRLDRDKLKEVGLTPATESYFWSLFFNLVDKLDRSNNATTSRFEWARISQYQGAADSNSEVSGNEPAQGGVPLFGNTTERISKINELIDALLSKRSAGQSFAPIDVPVQLSGTIREMSARGGHQADLAAKNVVVVVGGPRLGDKGRTCMQLRNDDNGLAELLTPKDRNIELVFLELVELADKPAIASLGLLPPTDIQGVYECNLRDSKWQGTAVSYQIDASQLLTGEDNRNNMVEALVDRIKKAFNNIGG